MLLQLIQSTFCLVLFVPLLMGPGSLRAQDTAESQNPQIEPIPPAPSNPPLPIPPEEAPTVIKPRLGDGLLIQDKKGNSVPVLAGTKLEEFLEWKRKQQLPAEEPAYSFSDVSLEGIATETNARLTATFTIQITKDEEWVSVPLRLEDATLTKFEHEYKPSVQNPAAKNSEGKAGFDSRDERGGLKWWFRGQGQHVLRLEIMARIRKSNGIRRLQLALPSAASSYLRLNIPVPNEQLSLETLVAGAHETTPAGKESTVVELYRLGPQLDLSWRALPDTSQVKTLLKAESELRIEPTEESILFKARQLIEPLQGSVKEIEVTLPGGFSVLELKVDGERYRPLDDFPDTQEPLKISLPAATTSRVRLDWILQSPWPASGQLVVEGFNVGDCLRQSGEIGIVEFEGYRIVKRSAKEVYRTNIRELLGPGPILSAYRFSQQPEQPFQLVLDLLQIEPTYSVRPHLFVKMGAKQIEMLADLELEVYRGVLESLEIQWPEFTEQGWVIDRTELPGLVEDVEQDPETGQITLPLAKRLTPGTQHPFRLRATRKIDATAPNPLPLTLPRVIASNPVRTVVVVTNQENVESNVSPVEGTETQPLSANFAEEVDLILSQPRMRDFRGPRQTGFLVRSDEQAFEVELVTHAQSIACETRLRAELSGERMQIEQRLSYDVKYERVSQLRVMVPDAFPKNVLFTLDGIPLSFEWTGLTVGNSRQARLTLPVPKLNQFDIVAHYEIAESDLKDHQLQLSCVRASDASEIKGRLELVTDYSAQVTVEGSHWTLAPEKETQNVWTTSTPGEMVRISWSPRKESDIQRFTVRRALVRSAIQRNGQIVCRADYQLEPGVDDVLISLPPDQILPDAFHWNGLELAESQIKSVDADSGTFRLTAPSTMTPESEEESTETHDATEKPVLSVTYHRADPAALNWSQEFALATPTFPGDVWIEKTLWEIALPVDQHLFTLPEGFTPEFSWTRQGLIWARAPRPSAQKAEAWIEDSSLADSLAFPLDGNKYRFSYFGPCSQLRFTSMNRSIVVLFGAGLALLTGFVLLKIPYTRNVLTVLVVVFAFAVCSVWYMAPMQVLLQPAGLGLLLAIVAVLVDTFFKRQRQANVITLPGAGEYGSSTGQPARNYPEVIGSEDPTAVRPAHPMTSDSQATQQRPPYQEESQDSPPALIGSSITEKRE